MSAPKVYSEQEVHVAGLPVVVKFSFVLAAGQDHQIAVISMPCTIRFGEVPKLKGHFGFDRSAPLLSNFRKRVVHDWNRRLTLSSAHEA